MTLSEINNAIEVNVKHYYLVYSSFLEEIQIMDRDRETVWAGNCDQLGEDELQLEVIPLLQEAD